MPDLIRATPCTDRLASRVRPPFDARLIVVSCALAHGLWSLAQAQVQTEVPVPRASAEEPLGLKASPRLQEKLPQSFKNAAPTFLFGERTTGRTDLETILEGDAVLRRGDTVILADRLEYYQPDDLARARGNVRINRAGNVYEGPLLELKVESFEGFFLQPKYRFLLNDGHGEADRVDFIDDKR